MTDDDATPIPFEEPEPFWVKEPDPTPEDDLGDDPRDPHNDYMAPAEMGEPFIIPGPIDPVADLEVDASGTPRPDPPGIGGDRLYNTFQAFPAVVVKTYYDSTHPSLGTANGIDIARADVSYDGTTNAPTVAAQPHYASADRPTVFAALPFPLCEDQPGFHVSVGDAVTALVTDDGRCWFMADELPFVGEVVTNDTDPGDTESAFGGVGNTLITVRRVQVNGDPTDDVNGYAFHASRTAITYPNVKVMTVTGEHHGHRIGTFVLVFRRGLNFFALPHSPAVVGEIVALGPAGEAAKTDERYWWKPVAFNGIYDGDATYDAASLTDLESTGIRLGINLEEYGASPETHGLSVGDKVLIHLFANPVAGDHKNEPVYVFSKKPPLTTEEAKGALCVNSDYSPKYPTGNPSAPHWDHMGGPTNSTATLAAGGGTTNAALMYVKGEMYDDGTKMNPWFVANIGPAINNYLTGETGSSAIFCMEDTPSAPGAQEVYAVGHMYTDGESKLNPWIMLSDYFCMVTKESGGLDVSADPDAYAFGHLYKDGANNQLNVQIGLNLSVIRDGKVKVDAADTAAYLEDQLDDDGVWIEVAKAVVAGDDDIMKGSHIGPGPTCFACGNATPSHNCIVVTRIDVDAKGHVRTFTVVDTYNAPTSYSTVGPSVP